MFEGPITLLSLFFSTKTKQNIITDICVFGLFSPVCLHQCVCNRKSVLSDAFSLIIYTELERPETLMETPVYDAFIHTFQVPLLKPFSKASVVITEREREREPKTHQKVLENTSVWSGSESLPKPYVTRLSCTNPLVM